MASEKMTFEKSHGTEYIDDEPRTLRNHLRSGDQKYASGSEKKKKKSSKGSKATHKWSHYMLLDN